MGYTPPWLDIRKVGAVTSVYPIQGTTDTLKLYMNSADAVPYIVLNGDIHLATSNGGTVKIIDNVTETGRFYYTSPDFIIQSQIADKNIYLNPNGTGKVKFGSYTAGAATDSTGYISILDSGGVARKLMVQA